MVTDMRHNPQPQEMYRHFKGNLYQVRCLAKHSETEEMMVVYQAMYGDFQTYVRPLASFMEEVDKSKYPDVAAKYRFELFNGQEQGQERAQGQQERVREQEQERRQEQAKKQEQSRTKGQEQAQAQVYGQEPGRVAEPDGRMAVSKNADTEWEEELEELNIDPLVLQFLDARTYERRLEILSMLHSRIDDDMINTMAVAVDVEIKEGDIEDRYEELKSCLLTFEKFECNRLR